MEGKMSGELSKELYDKLLQDQQDEITTYHLYHKISSFIKDKENSKIIKEMAEDELRHYIKLKKITDKELKPQKLKIFILYWITRILGVTFVIKLLENGENLAIISYNEKTKSIEGLDKVVADEERHESELINMIDEDSMHYMGSVVLGLNDALVELTGALAGFTFAFQNTNIIALTGLITGISASFSMAASEYLSKRHEGGKDAVKSSVYTGAAYIITVVLLVLPFLLLKNPFISLLITLIVVVLVIYIFNFYVSVVNDYDVKKRFSEMAAISLGVAGVSFLIGFLVRYFIGIDI